MADLFEYFGWNYVGAVAVDDSYGRYGVWALEKESFTRKSFCIALSEYIPRLNYMNKIKIIISKLKRERKVKVIVLWLFGGYGKRFLNARQIVRLSLSLHQTMIIQTLYQSPMGIVVQY